MIELYYSLMIVSCTILSLSQCRDTVSMTDSVSFFSPVILCDNGIGNLSIKIKANGF